MTSYQSVADQAISELVRFAVIKFCNKAQDALKLTTDSIRTNTGRAFTAYLADQSRLRAKAKTVLYRDTPRFIDDFYVPHDLTSNGGPSYKSICSNTMISNNQYTIISGTGGIGKSILLKHLFVNMLRQGDKIPIFLELRSLNRNDVSLQDLIKKELSQITVAESVIDSCLSRGLFVLLLDGFDEVSPQLKDDAAGSIQEICMRYPHLPIFVTSRPDDRFVGWSAFQQLNIVPFTLDKSLSLLHKLDYDIPTKDRFIAEVRSRLWNTHSSFLSNPLLLTIMLMTYTDHASVPSKMHLFYGEVFDTMWSKHDAHKDGYIRTLSSSLDKDDFVRILESFAFSTYRSSMLIFTSSEAEQSLDFASSYSGVKFSKQQYINDLVKSLCILNQDGLSLTYSHRSFQEYYTAKFILRLPLARRIKFVRNTLSRLASDQVLGLMKEIDSRTVEEEIIVPFIADLKKLVHEDPNFPPAARFAYLGCKEIHFMPLSDPGRYSLGAVLDRDVSAMCKFIRAHYFPEADVSAGGSRLEQGLEEYYASLAASSCGIDTLPSKTHVIERSKLLKFPIALEYIANSIGYFSGDELEAIPEPV